MERVSKRCAHSIGSAAAVALAAPLVRVLSSAKQRDLLDDVRRVREHSRGHDAGEVGGRER